MTTLLEQSDAFWDEYGVDNNFGELYEFDQIKSADPYMIWTIVEGDGSTENLYAVPGFSVVNKIGYILTEKPWTDATEQKIYATGPDSDDASPEDAP